MENKDCNKCFELINSCEYIDKDCEYKSNAQLKKINEVADIYISFPVDGYASMKQIQFYELIK